MAVAIKTRLRQLREELSDPKVPQEAIARKAEVSLQGYRRVEGGQNTSYTTAMAVLRALNDERQARGLAPLVLEQLELRIV